jgi:PadR family transcriptional regulator PadR
MSRVICVKQTRAPSPQVVRVLAALAAEPLRWRYGYDLGAQVSLKSGSLYPILIRLTDRGFLEATWEPGPPGKPPRHLYRLTSAGLETAATLTAEPASRPSAVSRRQLKEA